MAIPAAVLTLPLFWPAIADVGHEWGRLRYLYGPVVPALSVVMFVDALRYAPPSPGPLERRNRLGLCLACGGLSLAVLGNVFGTADVVFYALIVWVCGLVSLLFAGIAAWSLCLPWVQLLLALPMPYVLHRRVDAGLEWLTEHLARLAAPWVFRSEPGIAATGEPSLRLTELVHVLPVLSCACALAFLAGRSRPATAFAAFAAVPLTLLSGALLAASRPASQAVVDWLLPASGMLTLCALAAGVATLAPRPARDRRQPRPLLPASAPTALAAALLIGAVVGAGWLVAPQRPLMDSIPREPFSRFPPEIGAWSGTSVALSRRVERVLRADDYLSTIYYKAGSPAPVELFSAFNHSQARGEWIHPPEVCLPNDGWSIEDRELVSVGPGHAAGATLQLNRAVIVKPGERRLVYYWFVVSGKRMASEIAARLYTKYQRAVTGRSDGALVRLVTPLVPGEAPGAADARLRDFLGATARLLPRFVPETGSDP